MRTSVTLLGTVLALFVLAVPALALEDGIVETSSMSPSDDFTHADFERVITNTTGSPIDIAPRDLRMAEYPIMTVTEITVGTFDGAFWTVGTLEAGQTASIAYTGDVAPTTSAAPEELPFTGQRDQLAVVAIAGLALVGFGTSLLRATRD
jgi:hypothetical protein